METEKGNHITIIQLDLGEFSESLLIRKYQMTSRMEFNRFQDELITNLNKSGGNSSQLSN